MSDLDADGQQALLLEFVAQGMRSASLDKLDLLDGVRRMPNSRLLWAEAGEDVQRVWREAAQQEFDNLRRRRAIEENDE